MDVTVRALCKSATGAAAILKALSGAKTVSARVRLLTIMSESGIASVVQARGRSQRSVCLHRLGHDRSRRPLLPGSAGLPTTLA